MCDSLFNKNRISVIYRNLNNKLNDTYIPFSFSLSDLDSGIKKANGNS